MSVDNSGYFLIGCLLDEIDFSNFPKFDQIQEDDDISEFYYYEGDDLLELRLNWQLSEPAGYVSSNVFGYWLSSPSYGTSDYGFIDFVSDLGIIQKAWREWTGKSPKVYVLNIQS